jgi:MtN3 and saliva related transmembrane protein
MLFGNDHLRFSFLTRSLSKKQKPKIKNANAITHELLLQNGTHQWISSQNPPCQPFLKMSPDTLGFIAAILTTGSFLPQIIKLIRERKTQGISVIMYCMSCTGNFLWVVYGFWANSWPVIISSSISFLLASTVLFIKVSGKK